MSYYNHLNLVEAYEYTNFLKLFQVKYSRITKNFEWIIWNRVVTIKCMIINFGWIKRRKTSVSPKWNAFMLRNPDSQLLLSFTYIGGRTLSASILINNRISKWKWDAIFEFKEILNRVTGLENNSSIDLRIEMFDNELKPAFHPQRLNTKKRNFKNTSHFGTVMTGGLQLYKELPRHCYFLNIFSIRI